MKMDQIQSLKIKSPDYVFTIHWIHIIAFVFRRKYRIGSDFQKLLMLSIFYQAGLGILLQVFDNKFVSFLWSLSKDIYITWPGNHSLCLLTTHR